MSKPATDMRLQRAAEGFTEVIGRGNAHIITKNPTTGKCCYDGRVGGGWHYNGDQETDTAWEQDAVTAYLKMVKAGYNLRARKLFNAGDLIQWTDPVSGQYVKFQPQNFQWIDGTTGSNSLISVAQAVASPSIDDDKLYWPAAFGAGRHFRYTAAPTKLIKHLIIDSAANLPACPAWITNPWLELTFTLTPSSGVTMYVDGVAWDRAKSKTTANAIEFRLPSGQVVWSMAAPLAYDSSPGGAPLAGQIKLYVNKKVKYASVRFPKAWIDSAVFPIILDPAVDYQVGASGDDGYASGIGFEGSYSMLSFGQLYGTYIHAFVRFAVTIPVGATITNAYLSFVHVATSGSPTGKIHVEEASDPAAVTSWSDLNARSWSAEYVSIVDLYADNKWHNTPDISGLVQGVVDAYDFSSGAHMQFKIHGGGAGGYHAQDLFSWDYSDNTLAPKLHIEYTEAASGNPFYAYAQQ